MPICFRLTAHPHARLVLASAPQLYHTHSTPYTLLTQLQMPVVTSSSPKLRFTARHPRSPPTLKSPSSNKFSNRCCSSNSVSSLPFHLVLLPPVLAEKSLRLSDRKLNRLSKPSLLLRLLHRFFLLSLATFSSWYLGICSSIPASVYVYFPPSPNTTTTTSSLCMSNPWPLSRPCHDIIL